jgi:hypothetical protein
MERPRNDSTPRPERAAEIVVFQLRNTTRCAECGEELDKGRLLRLERERPLCLACADLDHLEFLPRGDAAVTRRATKYSKLRAVVVRWSSTRQQYERQGILVEPAAIRRAEEDCLADADRRARQRERDAARREELDQQYVAAFARAIREHFPGCPPAEVTEIAEHACRKYSGRVGRSAAAKEFAAAAIRLAVIAHIRHGHTRYDEILVETADRVQARAEIQDEVERWLAKWQAAP